LAANYGGLESSIAQTNKEYIYRYSALNKEVAAASEV
jgi:hypothetical protein